MMNNLNASSGGYLEELYQLWLLPSPPVIAVSRLPLERFSDPFMEEPMRRSLLWLNPSGPGKMSETM